MYLVKSYQVCDSQDFLSVKYEPYNVPTSKDIKIGAGVELVLTGMLPPCSKTYAQCFLSFDFVSLLLFLGLRVKKIISFPPFISHLKNDALF